MSRKELAYLKRLFAWAVEYEFMTANPAKPVDTRGLAVAREHYVQDNDYFAMLVAAPLNVAVMAHLAYLTGRRRTDILKIKRGDLELAGIYFEESKTDKAAMVGWTEELEQLIALAEEIAGETTWLFPGSPGSHYSRAALSTAWVRTMQEIAKAGFTRFQFKDLRAKHASDLEDAGGNATENLLHSSRGVTKRHYLRRPKKVVSLR